MDAQNTSITSHLEGFLNSARKLEEALSEEKSKSQRIAQEYLATRTTLENGVRELQSRLLQRENKIQAITEAFRTLQASESKLKTELRDISEREKKASTDLAQYQTAWNEVLARESQARGALIEYEKAKRTLAEQRNQIQSLENSIKEVHQSNQTHARHADTYQRELQSALIRIQSAESKYNQIQKELSVITQNKRNADEEIARIENSMKERFRWELATEKERLKAELEKDSALDRERFREIARNQMRAEIERAVQNEKQAREAAIVELEKVNKDQERLRIRLSTQTDDLNKIKSENRALQEAKAISEGTLMQRAEHAEKSLLSLRSDAAMNQMELTQLQLKFENSKKESNKAFLMERLRNEATIAEMTAKIDSLMNDGFFVERIEAAPESAVVYAATPVTSLRANDNNPPATHVVGFADNTFTAS